MCCTEGAERKDRSASTPLHKYHLIAISLCEVWLPTDLSSCLKPDWGNSPADWKMFPVRLGFSFPRRGFNSDTVKLLLFRVP